MTARGAFGNSCRPRAAYSDTASAFSAIRPGDSAQRNLFNRMLGCLRHRLAGRTDYDEAIAFLAPKTPDIAEAA
jgi:hypothetical protein